jgi:hypothetical protein
MRKYIIITALFFLTSCCKNSYPKFDYNYTKSPWKNAFKDRFFFTALQEAYKLDSSIFILIEKYDAFNPYDGLDLDEIKKAKKIAIEFIKKMPPPLMCEGCKNGENYFMASCLHYYNSKEFELIVNKLYREKRKREKKIYGTDLFFIP